MRANYREGDAMGRPIYSYELGDPDFSWLISNFRESRPEYTLVESDSLPLVFIESVMPSVDEKEFLLGPAESSDADSPTDFMGEE